MVGRQALALLVGVRILLSQLSTIYTLTNSKREDALPLR